MRCLIIILILTITSVKAQTDTLRYNFDNSITNVFSKIGNTSSLTLNASGDNSLAFNFFNIKSNTNYLFKYQGNVIFNELLQRTNLEQNRLFISHQFNRSYIRKISSDNSIGVGYGIKLGDERNINLSISYAIMTQHTEYGDKPKSDILRHSIRGGLKHTNKLFNISVEYYYQPNFKDMNDYILYGTTRIKFLPKQKLNFIVQDDINYRTTSNVISIHNITFGFNYSIGGVRTKM